MPNDRIDGLLNRLVSGSGDITGAEREQLRSAILGAAENESPLSIADIAAELDVPQYCDQGKEVPCEVKSAEEYLARVAAEDQPIPASLLRLVGVEPAKRPAAGSPGRAPRLAGLRRKHVLPWGSAIAATVVAGISGYVVHDFVGRATPAPSSAVLPNDIADARRAPENSTVANTDAVPQQPAPSANMPVPTLVVTPPTPITNHTIFGAYPPESIRRREEGTVKVRYLVSVTGRVGQCQIEDSSGYANLDDAACVLVKRWRFKPATLADGTAVDWWVDDSIVFNLARLSGGVANSTAPQTPAIADAQSIPGPARSRISTKNEALVKAINDMNAAARAQNWTLALEKAREADAIKNDKPAALNAPIHFMIVTAAINAHDYAAALGELDKEIASGEGNRIQNLKTALGVAIMSKNKEKTDQYERELAALGILGASQLHSSPPPPPPPISPVATTSHAVTADDYPPVSIRLQEQGKVAIKYLVKEDGTVGDCNVTGSSGYSRLDDAACTMAKRRWKFKPATQNGKAVAEYLTAEVVFQLK